MSDGKAQSRSEDREPSMEEILSSIRKIIASDDDEEEKPAKPGAAPAGARKEPEESDEVLELTEVVPGEGGAGRGQPAAASDLDALEKRARAELDEVTQRVEAVETPPPPRAAVSPAESLVSEAAASAATAAFAKLTRSVSRPEPGPVVPDSGKSVEVFVAELLRPMLKEWLDANLPAIVERVVEQEVKKLAKRAELL